MLVAHREMQVTGVCSVEVAGVCMEEKTDVASTPASPEDQQQPTGDAPGATSDSAGAAADDNPFAALLESTEHVDPADLRAWLRFLSTC
jgi:hypothetical protein